MKQYDTLPVFITHQQLTSSSSPEHNMLSFVFEFGRFNDMKRISVIFLIRKRKLYYMLHASILYIIQKCKVLGPLMIH